MIVETKTEYFTINPKYILSFYFYNMVALHLIDFDTDKKRKYCVGQWIIKYKK